VPQGPLGFLFAWFVSNINTFWFGFRTTKHLWDKTTKFMRRTK